MPLSPELAELLIVGLRERPGSVEDLARLAHLPIAETRRHLGALEHLGYVDHGGDTITYRRPDAPVTEFAHLALTEATDHLRRAAGDVDAALTSLPSLLRAWDTGDDEAVIRVDTTAGATAPTDAWMDHIARDTPARCDMCLPDLAALVGSDRPEAVADWLAAGIRALRIRLLVSEADARDPALRPVVRGAARRGIEIRTHPRPPGFYWISDDQIAGLPARWGEGWPATVLTVRSPTVAGVVIAAFGQAWRAASPLRDSAHGPDRGWDSMLTLMNEGMTMESAAARLGLAPRTARRRVAAAMQYYGVSGQFALGAAWGRDRSRPDDTR